MTNLTVDALRARRAELVDRHERLSIDLIALAGAIQVLDELLAEAEPSTVTESAMTLGDLAERIGGIQSIEVVKNED